MAVMEREQLTLDVGGEIGDFIVSEFTVSGKLTSKRYELEREDKVFVRIFNEDGEVLVSAEAWVSQVAFETKPRTETSPKHTIRKHTVKLD